MISILRFRGWVKSHSLSPEGLYFVKDDERVLFHSGLSEVKDYVRVESPSHPSKRQDREKRSTSILRSSVRHRHLRRALPG